MRWLLGLLFALLSGGGACAAPQIRIPDLSPGYYRNLHLTPDMVREGLAAAETTFFLRGGGGGPPPNNNGGCPTTTCFYVNASTGSDGNPGTQTAPWQTLNKVVSGPPGGYTAGTTIAFAAGQSFAAPSCYGSSSHVEMSFYLSSNTELNETANISTATPPTSSSPITVTSYGSGAAPVINAVCGNTGSTEPPYTYGALIDGVPIIWNGVNFSANGNTTRNCFVVESNAGLEVDLTMIENSTFSGCHLPSTATTDTSSEINVPVPGTAIGTPKCAIFKNIMIVNNILQGASGLTSTDSGGQSVGSVSQCGTFTSASSEPISNYLFAGNTIQNIGMSKSGNSGYGVVLGMQLTNGGTIEYNLIQNNMDNANHNADGTILISDSNNITIQYNELSNNYATGGGGSVVDVFGIDLDSGTTRATVQYNYIHEQGGAAVTFYMGSGEGPGWFGNTVRYNVFQDNNKTNAQATILGLEAAGTCNSTTYECQFYVYNNDIYQNQTRTGIAAFGYAPDTGFPTYGVVANNVFAVAANTSGDNSFVNLENTTEATVPSFVSNAYYPLTSGTFQAILANTTYSSLSTWQAAVPGGETGATQANPQFIGTPPAASCSWTPSSNGPGPNAACPSAYQLNNASPYIGVGVDLTKSPYSLSVGSSDYYGNTIPTTTGTGYSIGAYAH